jgi:NAD-dependent DNA ligase
MGKASMSKPKTPKKESGGIRKRKPLAGLTLSGVKDLKIVVTGTLNSSQVGREKFKKLVEKASGKVVGPVSRTTSYLLEAINPGLSKIAMAKELGVEIIGEDRGRNALHPLNFSILLITMVISPT